VSVEVLKAVSGTEVLKAVSGTEVLKAVSVDDQLCPSANAEAKHTKTLSLTL
jgi:hypothetical protein